MSSLYRLIDNSNSVTYKLPEWESILEKYHREVSENDVWEIARDYKEFPMLENIYQMLVLHNLEDIFFNETGLDYECINIFTWVNGIDTHLVIDGDDIATYQEFIDVLGKYKKH
ncbi:hypothetical protein ACWIYZ_07460 [Ursidibacter arcticus]